MRDKKFQYLLKNGPKNPEDLGEFYRNENNRRIVLEITKDVKKFNKYTLSTKYNNLLSGLLIRYSNMDIAKVKYLDFLTILKIKMIEMVSPVVLIVPLNCLKASEIGQNINISNDINIFVDKYSFKNYIEKTLYLNQESFYSIGDKDKCFNCYPFLTIKFNNIPDKIENNSSKIVEGIYCLIRMFSFELENSYDDTWEFEFRLGEPYSNTYGVYSSAIDKYNDLIMKQNSKIIKVKRLRKKINSQIYFTLYGYQLRYTFSPILEINPIIFKDINMNFKELLERYIDMSFRIEKLNQFEHKWINSIRLFNTAYEFASVEKFNSSLIILISILECLFSTNKHSDTRQDMLERIYEFLKRNKSNYTNNKIDQILTKNYINRNKFVHEGKVLFNGRNFKSLNDYSGVFQGRKPFKENLYTNYNDAVFDLKELMILVKDILLNEDMNYYK